MFGGQIAKEQMSVGELLPETHGRKTIIIPIHITFPRISLEIDDFFAFIAWTISSKGEDIFNYTYIYNKSINIHT